MERKIAIIVHGGAGQGRHDGKVEPFLAGCRLAADAGWSVLESAGSALDAVERAVRCLEDNPLFNSGHGSTLTEEGIVEMDAGIMDGRTLDAGCVAAVKAVRNPISAARKVLESDSVLLVGEGAQRFAEAAGVPACDPDALVTDYRRKMWAERNTAVRAQADGHDTVGCVALDAEGNVAAATSTGGLAYCRPGRVGDSPLVGAGFYADNLLGACSLTGVGEAITRVVLGKAAVDMLANDRDPYAAAEAAIDVLNTRVRSEAGIILVDREGRIGWAHNTPYMACAYRMPGMPEPAAYSTRLHERR